MLQKHHYEIDIVFVFSTASQKDKNKKKKMKKKIASSGILPIQSQLCLPLDQGFMKIAWKYQKFLTRFFKIQNLDVFS